MCLHLVFNTQIDYIEVFLQNCSLVVHIILRAAICLQQYGENAYAIAKDGKKTIKIFAKI